MEIPVLKSFICTKCGSCCRNVNRWEELKPIIHTYLGVEIEFPFISNNGICPMLNHDNTCSIYNNRPNCCRTNYIYEILNTKFNISLDEFIFLQEQSCILNQNLQE